MGGRRILGFASFGCALSLALAAAAQPPGAQPPGTQPPGAKPAAVDPATRQGLPAARDYASPSDIGFRASNLFSDNVRLTAQWFYPAAAASRRLPTVIMAPGWGAAAATLRSDAVDLARAGYRVMLFDYRGWGESDGRVVRAAGGGVTELRGYMDPWEQAQDWFNAISYAAADPGVDPARIGLMGADLAGGHVIYAAAHDPRVKALVSLVSSVDLRPYKPYQPDPAARLAAADADAARLASGEASYPPERARSEAGFIGAPVGAKALRWAPVELAGQVSAPALFILAQDEELFANANNGQLACERVTGPRKMIILPRITHYGVYGAERERAIRAAIAWFDLRLKPPAPDRATPSRKEPERGECAPPPVPPKGEEDANGSGEGHKAQDASARFN